MPGTAGPTHSALRAAVERLREVEAAAAERGWTLSAMSGGTAELVNAARRLDAARFTWCNFVYDARRCLGIRAS